MIWNFWLGVTGKLFNVIKNSVGRSFLSKQGQCWQSRDALLLQMLAAWGWRRASLGRQRFRALWRVRMFSGTYLSHCSSVFVFRLFGGSDQGWLFSCFVLQQRKQSILLVHLVAKGGFYFKLQLSWKLLSLEGAWVPCFKVVDGNGVLIGGTGTFTLIQVLCWLHGKPGASLEQRGKTGCDDLL